MTNDETTLPNYIPQIDRTVQYCTREDVDAHLSVFINSFVFPMHRARWRELLVAKRPVWDRENLSANQVKLYHKACMLMNSFTPFDGSGFKVDRNRLPQGWYERNYRDKMGLFFMPRMPACIVTPSEAHAIADFYDESCILSLKPGKDMLFYQHDGLMYRSS